MARDWANASQRLRILSYNIQVGITYTRYRHYLTQSWKHVLPFPGRLENLESIARFISEFDIVGLQEVDAGSLRSNYINQAQYLAQQAGFSNWYAQTNRNLGRLAQHSLGLLTRIRSVDVKECKLPSKIPGRGALTAVFGEGEHKLLIGILHLSLGRKARTCRIDHPEFQALLDSTHLCSPEKEFHTFPSWNPRRGLDHILVTPSLKVKQTYVYNTDYSDHLPIALDIHLPSSIHLDKSYTNALVLPSSTEPVALAN